MDKRTSEETLRLYHSWDGEGAATHLEPCKQPKSEGPCNATYTENWYKAADVDIKVVQLKAQLVDTGYMAERGFAMADEFRMQLAAAEAKIERIEQLCLDHDKRVPIDLIDEALADTEAQSSFSPQALAYTEFLRRCPSTPDVVSGLEPDDTGVHNGE